MRTTWTFHVPGQIVFGRNAVQHLGELAKQHNARRVLVATDAMLVKAGILASVQQPFEKAGIAVDVFDGGEPEPSMTTVMKCVQKGHECQPDVIIGLGGGSNMDLAKAAATVLMHGGHPRDYVGDCNIPGPIVPLWCVPTTSGTGSEISFAAVLNDEAQGFKVGVLSNFLRPQVAIVDPMLTVSCPPHVTADSGIDALTHAIEAYMAVDNTEFPLPKGEHSVYQGKHPLGDLTAEKAISLVGKFLRKAVADGNDLEAREGMSLGSMIAGMSFSNVGIGLVHGLEYAVGAATELSHGRGNGLLLPYVMRFNKAVHTNALVNIAKLLGEDIGGMSQDEAAETAIIAVEKLRNDIGIPTRLRDVGVAEGQLRGLAEKTFGIKRILRMSPRPVTMDDLEEILRAAY